MHVTIAKKKQTTPSGMVAINRDFALTSPVSVQPEHPSSTLSTYTAERVQKSAARTTDHA